MEYKSISINDLPKYTRWIDRILGIEHFSQKYKNEKELEREYENEKWKPLLSLVNDNIPWGIVELDKTQYLTDNQSCIWYQDNFYLMTSYEAYDLYLNLLVTYLKPYIDDVSALVELGSGYGNIILNLSQRLPLTHKNLYAGEFSKSGVEISKIMANREKVNLQSYQCNFFDLDLSLFNIPKNSLIFTSYALISVPEMPLDFLEKLLSVKPKYIAFFEPCKELYDMATTFGLLKSKYIDLNDYNKNIYSYFTNSSSISPLKIEKNILGLNPLLPISILIFEVKY